MDAFGAVSIANGGSSEPGYQIHTIGLTGTLVPTESGLLMKPDYTTRSAPRVDTLVIPGGRSMRGPEVAAKYAPWIAAQATKARRIASICTGAFGVARAGLLTGRRVATHWRYAADLKKQYPDIDVDGDALFVKDGNYYSSAGITAGIDLALALIEEDYGPSLSLGVARELVVYLRRPGGQAQFSEPLKFETENADRISDVAKWISTNFTKRITVELLAERAGMCPRHFARRFKQSFGVTPAEFVEGVRLAEARRRLAASARNIDRVAQSLGYRSTSVFRLAFERRFGVAPSAYRKRFAIGNRGRA
jgi:transcriptional regulator GlxA family with amidase domain